MGAQSQKRRLILFAALLLAALPLSAQQRSGQTDSLVRLLNARFLEQVETDGRMARKAVEPTFLHNGTYLSCDTALWHVDEKIINCYGHVQLIQGESVLTSAKLDYLIDDNLAQFRGAVVELRNKQDNVLRTRVLDYNTQDSLAVFRGGASMMSADGQIIESDEGSYANARSFFSFLGNVNMFTDSVFVRTDSLDYDSRRERADFLAPIDFWKEGNMLSAGGGWYERGADIFYFEKDVHGLGDTEESWSDSLYYYRRTNDVLMLGGVQIQDQSRKVAAMGDRLHYVDSLARVTLEERASAALWDDGHEQPDENAEVPEESDSDGDGIPDAWERAHGLNPVDPDDAAKDPDGDHFTNLEEFDSGTDPNDAKAHPALHQFLRVADTAVTPFRFIFNGTKRSSGGTKDGYKFTITDPQARRDYYVVKGGELAGTGFVLQDWSSEWVERETNTGKRRIEVFTLVLRKGDDEVVMRESTPAVSSVYEVTFSCDKAPDFKATVQRNATFEIDGARLTLLSLSSDRSTAQVRIEGTQEVLSVSK